MSLGLAISLVGLCSLALGLLLIPLLLRPRLPAARGDYDLAVYRDQLAEVERDLGRGLLTAEQAEAARVEIGRRMLALPPAPADAGADPKRLVATVIAVLVLPVAALLIYAQLGAPLLPDRPLVASAAGADDSGHVDMQQALAKLRAHLQAQPDDLTGWLLLARSEVGLGHYQQGADAYRRAADLSGQRAEILGDWGEAQVLAAGGTVTSAAREAFEAALKDPEAAPRARYYLALGQMQQGDLRGAVAAWQKLAADSPSDAAWLPVVRQRIAEAEAKLGGKTTQGAGPEPAAVAAMAKSLSDAAPGERLAAINAMVARLAARLQQQPDDVEGWARLGRSYMVLNQPQKARDAYARAVKLKPDDAALKQALAEAEKEAQPSR